MKITIGKFSNYLGILPADFLVILLEENLSKISPTWTDRPIIKLESLFVAF
jgi:hypothetical protein